MQRFGYQTRQDAEAVCPSDCFVRKTGQYYAIVPNNRPKRFTRPGPCFREEPSNRDEFNPPGL